MRYVSYTLVLTALMACSKPGQSVNSLYHFPAASEAAVELTKDVQVEVQVDYKVNAQGGPAVTVGTQQFLLEAYLFDGQEEQVKIAPAGQDAVSELPVTLTGTHLTLDTVLRIPTAAEAGANGYSFHFTLKTVEASLALDDTSTTSSNNLEALKGGVEPGDAASANIVPLSLATTLAYQLTVDSGVDDGSTNHLTAYNALVTPLAARLKDVEATIKVAATPTLATFASALLSSLKLQIMQDQALQSTITGILQPALATLKGDQASTLLATGFTTALKGFATDVKTALGSDTSAESLIFTSGTIDPSSIPDPAAYVSVIFAPAAVSFTDSDSSTALGGDITITPPGSKAGIQSYNVYFGGETLGSGRGRLLGNVLASASPLVLHLASGTSQPSGMTRFWVFPVASAELDLATSVVIFNLGGTNATPSAPTPVAATASADGVTVTWGAVAGATSYNLYWTDNGTVSTSSNKITSVTSPYLHRGRAVGVTYRYAVTAVKNGLESALSNAASAVGTAQTTTPTNAVPGAFAIFSAQAGAGQVVLTWGAASGAVSYQVTRGTASGTYGTTVSAAATSPYTDTTAANGTTYYYMVTAVNTGGSRRAAAEATATPVAPGAVLSGTVVSGTEIDLTWTTLSGATLVLAYQTGSTAPTSCTAGATIANTSPYQVTNLAPGTTYSFVLCATTSSAVLATSAAVATPANVQTTPQVSIAAPGSHSCDSFGSAVAVAGDRALIGDIIADSNFDGTVYAYQLIGGVWTYQQTIPAVDGGGLMFGGAVAMTATRALIGTGNFNSSPHNSAYYYEYNSSSGQWEIKYTFQGSNADGNNVAIDDTLAVVGNPAESGTASVEVYQGSGTSWTTLATLSANGDDQAFGHALVITPNYLFVGSPKKSGSGSYGSTFIYNRADFTAAPTELTETNAVWYGRSVATSVDGSVVAIADPYFNYVTDGQIFLYKLTAGVWTQTQVLNTADTGIGAYYGTSLAMNPAGNLLFVGEPGGTGGGTAGGGFTNVFRYASGTWTHTDTIQPLNPLGYEGMGGSMALSGNSLIMGTWNFANYGGSAGGNDSNAMFIDTNPLN